jgi:hypothetical protein
MTVCLSDHRVKNFEAQSLRTLCKKLGKAFLYRWDISNRFLTMDESDAPIVRVAHAELSTRLIVYQESPPHLSGKRLSRRRMLYSRVNLDPGIIE